MYILRRFARTPLSLIWGGWPNPKSGVAEEREFIVYQGNGGLMGIVEYTVFRPGYGEASTPWGSVVVRAISSYGYEIALDARPIATIAANPLFTRIQVTFPEARQEWPALHRQSFVLRPGHPLVTSPQMLWWRLWSLMSSDDYSSKWRLAEHAVAQRASFERETSREAEGSFDWDIEIPSCTDGIKEVLVSLVAILSYRRLEDEIPLHK